MVLFQAVPGGIPSRYQKALVHRDRQIDMWQKMVKEAGLSRDQRKQFQALVENKFQVRPVHGSISMDSRCVGG